MRSISAGWLLSDEDGSTRLQIRYRVPLGDLLPGYLRRNLPWAVGLFALNVVAFGLAAWILVGRTWLGLLGATPAVLAASLAWLVIAWPLRFGDIFEPPSMDYYLRYRHANRVEVSILTEAHLENWDGMFDLESLRSLRIERVDRFGDLVNLVFDGNVVHDVQLVGWPGLPESVARELCDALLVRVRGAHDATLQHADRAEDTQR